MKKTIHQGIVKEAMKEVRSYSKPRKNTDYNTKHPQDKKVKQEKQTLRIIEKSFWKRYWIIGVFLIFRAYGSFLQIMNQEVQSNAYYLENLGGPLILLLIIWGIEELVRYIKSLNYE